MLAGKKTVLLIVALALAVAVCWGPRGSDFASAQGPPGAPAPPTGAQSAPPGGAPPGPSGAPAPAGNPSTAASQKSTLLLSNLNSKDLDVRELAAEDIRGLLATALTRPKDFAELRKLVAPMVPLALAGPTTGLRLSALQCLASTTDVMPEYTRVVLKCTYDPNQSVQEEAVTLLAMCPALDEADQRLEELSQSGDNELASRARQALFARWVAHGAKAVPQLCRRLADAKGDIRTQAALHLYRVKPQRDIVPMVMQALQSNPDPSVRHGAAMVLALVCVGASPTQKTFHESTQTIYKVAMRSPAAPVDLRPQALFMDRLLNDSSSLVREVCAEGLGYQADPHAAPALAQALTRDPEPKVRVRAAAAFVLVRAPEAAAPLGQALRQDKSVRVRRQAAEALGWTATSEAVAALLQGAQDGDAEVRRTVATQLGRLRTPKSIPTLVNLFQDPNEDVRWTAVRAVGAIGALDPSPQALDALVAAVDDPSALVARASEDALRKLGITRRSTTHLKPDA